MRNLDMNKAVGQRDKETAERDRMLLELLKTPPQPRPKRERGKSVPPKGEKARKTPDK